VLGNWPCAAAPAILRQELRVSDDAWWHYAGRQWGHPDSLHESRNIWRIVNRWDL